MTKRTPLTDLREEMRDKAAGRLPGQPRPHGAEAEQTHRMLASRLIELAEICEAGVLDERTVLWEAFKLCFPGSIHPHTDGPEGVHREVRFIALLDAKGFLDAAMTLVPDGSGVLMDTPGSYVGKSWAHINPRREGQIPRPIKAEAATLPLALCAAALRARAAGSLA
jgi:hypothetical protein